jgi:hypothetical protein
MELEVKRKFFRPEYTIGDLYVDGELFCNTIEDKYRDLSKEIKVPEKTCIPYGRYRITLNVTSPKYKNRKQYAFCEGRVPRLIDVPYFEGILIHIGNTAEDSAGCILVGKAIGDSNKVGRLNYSTETFQKLYAKLSDAKDQI